MLVNKLKNRLKKSGGFTLIEMLIVVAIIAILVAVSIPMVTSSLEKAREATDMANERAAKAAAVIEYMTKNTVDTNASYYYDAKAGTISSSTPSTGYGQCKEHKGGYIVVKFSSTAGEEGKVTLTWANIPGSTTAHENMTTSTGSGD